MPELFRSVHHLGAPLTDARHQAIHDAWFRPLLEARAAVHATTRTDQDPSRQVAHFTAAQLVVTYQQIIADLARMEYPEGGAAMRALEARYEEAAAPLFTALQALHIAERELVRSLPNAAETAWSSWIHQLRIAIDAIDATFPDIVQLRSS